MIKTSEFKKGIELCLENGKRLLDDALSLQQKRRYRSAIPLFILGYEEVNKAVFLDYKFEKNDDVTDEEYKKIFQGSSHLAKNQMFFNITKKRLEEMSDWEFQTTKSMVESKTSVKWHDKRSDSLLHASGALSLVAKFNKIKKEFLYIDYVDKKWITYRNRFSDNLLDSLCTVLYYTALESYLKTRFLLDMELIGLYRKNILLDSEDGKKVLQNQYSLELEKIYHFFQSSKWINANSKATTIIESI